MLLRIDPTTTLPEFEVFCQDSSLGLSTEEMVAEQKFLRTLIALHNDLCQRNQRTPDEVVSYRAGLFACELWFASKHLKKVIFVNCPPDRMRAIKGAISSEEMRDRVRFEQSGNGFPPIDLSGPALAILY